MVYAPKLCATAYHSTPAPATHPEHAYGISPLDTSRSYTYLGGLRRA